MKTKLFSKKKAVAVALAVATPLTFVAPAMMSKTFYADIPSVRASVTSTTVTKDATGDLVKFTGYKSKYETKDGADGYALPVPKDSENNVISRGSVDLTVRKSNGMDAGEYLAETGYSLKSTTPAGDYIVTYKFTKTEGENTVVTAKDFAVSIVESYKATLTFKENSANIIPLSVKTGDTIKIDLPEVYFDGKKIGALSKDNIVVTDGNGNVKQTTQTENSDFVSYVVAESEGSSLTISYTGSVTIGEGQSAITYNFTPQKKTVNVVKDYETTAIKYSAGSLPISNITLKVGKESTLPTPKVLNDNGDEITDVYTVVTVKNVDDPDSAKTVTDFKFMPEVAGTYSFEYKTVDFAGHEVTANIGRITANYSASDTITIYATEGYAVTEGTSESTINLDLDEISDLSNSVPTLLYANNTTTVDLNLPAILAVSDKKISSFGKLTLNRTIADANKADSDIITVESDTRKANEQVTYTLDLSNLTPDENGDYKVKINYTAAFSNAPEDGDNISETKSYTLTIKTGPAPSSTITLGELNVPTSVLRGKEINFSEPSITDSYDTKHQVTVSYAFGNGDFKTLKKSGSQYTIDTADAKAGDTVVKIQVSVSNDAGQTQSYDSPVEVIITNESTDTSAPTITFENFDNLASINGNAEDNGAVSLTAYITDKDGNVVDTLQSTTVTATKAYIENKAYTPNANGEYTVTFVATDEAGNCAVMAQKFTVTITTAYSTSIDQIATQEYNDSFNILDKIHLTNLSGSINASASDITVFYTNTNFDSTKIDSDTDFRKFGVTCGFITKTGDDAYSINDGKFVVVYLSGAYEFDLENGAGYIKTLQGDISVRAWAISDNLVGEGSNLVTFASSDTSSPVFNIENEDLNDTHVDFNEDTKSASYLLPWFNNITDSGVGVDLNTAKVTWTLGSTTTTKTYKDINGFEKVVANDKVKKNANGTFTKAASDATGDDIYTVVADTATPADKQIKVSDANNKLTSNPLLAVFNKQGKVEVKYSIADKQGNVKESSTYTIHVGDTTAPVIDGDSVDKAITAPKEAKDGGKIVIDLEKIVVSKDEVDTTSDKFKVTVKKDGKEVETTKVGKTYEVEAAEAGEYVVSFTAEDTAGNKSTAVNRTYTVDSKKSSTSNSTTVWGTILIVVALIVLALTIFFYTKSSKTKVKPAELKTDRKKEDDKKAE